LVGNLVSDPDLFKTKEGKSLGKVSVCVNDSYKTSTGFKNRPYYFQVTIFDEYILKRLTKHQKGDLVYTEGDIVPSVYIDKEGNKMFTINFIAKSFIGPGLKTRVNKEDDNIYAQEAIAARPTRIKTTTPTDDRRVSAEEVEEIFNDIDI
jgi:single-stranded DNA-binding protein